MTGVLRLPAGSAGAGAKLVWQAWLPAEPMRAVVVLAHGYAEHFGRYAYFAAKLNAAGIGVYALDHWGHGQSDGTPGLVPAFSAFTDGVEALLDLVRREHGDTPRFLVGHSMGGLIAAAHLVTHQQHYDGAILSGPAIKAAEEPSKLMIWVAVDRGARLAAEFGRKEYADQLAAKAKEIKEEIIEKGLIKKQFRGPFLVAGVVFVRD